MATRIKERPVRRLTRRSTRAMTAKLHNAGFAHAKGLVSEGLVVRDERDDWSEHQPSAQAENEFIRTHGMHQYGLWHLGIDLGKKQGTKAHYKFPYGDFRKLHRCAVLAAESRAGQNKYDDINLPPLTCTA